MGNLLKAVLILMFFLFATACVLEQPTPEDIRDTESQDPGSIFVDNGCGC